MQVPALFQLVPPFWRIRNLIIWKLGRYCSCNPLEMPILSHDIVAMRRTTRAWTIPWHLFSPSVFKIKDSERSKMGLSSSQIGEMTNKTKVTSGRSRPQNKKIIWINNHQRLNLYRRRTNLLTKTWLDGPHWLVVAAVQVCQDHATCAP